MFNTRTVKAAMAGLLVGLSLTGAVAAQAIKIGGKDFTEQYVMAEMTSQLLAAKGFEVQKSDGMGTSVVRAALESGAVDIYWEYTGTSLVTFNKVMQMLSPEDTYETVKRMDGEKGLVWLAPSAVNNTYALAIKPGNAKTDAWASLSDMAAAYVAGTGGVMATTAEFPQRDDGLIGLQKTYEFEAGRPNIKPMDPGLVFEALDTGNVDIAVVAATDGRIAAMGLKLLEDDKNFFPNYALVPVIRADTLAAHPELQGVLESLSALLTDSVMQGLNGAIDVEGKSIEEVATGFLTEEGLI